MTRALIYARVSTDDQAERQTPIQSQVDACAAWCAREGLEVAEVFADEGVSGSTLDRPGLTRARELAQQGAGDALVVWELSRLSRDTADMLLLIREFRSAGVRVCSVLEPLDRETPFGQLATTLQAGMAQFELSLIRDRMMRGKEATAGRGRWASGQTPYGYRNTSQGLVVVPEEAAVLRLAWEHLREGRTQTEAAGLLNAAGLRTRAGREWSGAVLMQCLRRPAVYGHVRFGYARRATAGEVVWVPDAHEPILRPEDVAALGYRLGEWYLGEQRDRTEHRRKHVLSGLLYCLCGTMMRAGAGTPPRILYNCPEGGRRRGHSPAQVIGRREPEVWAWVWQHAVTERRLVAIHRRAIREAEEPSARYAAQVAETETALGGAERRLQNLVDAVAQEGLSLALRRALQEQEQVVKRLQAEVARLAYAAEVSHPPDLPPDLRARITRLRQVVPTLTAPRQNQLLRHVLERVDVAADGTLSCCVASAQVLRLLST